jgi:hypothetical protein
MTSHARWWTGSIYNRIPFTRYQPVLDIFFKKNDPTYLGNWGKFRPLCMTTLIIQKEYSVILSF